MGATRISDVESVYKQWQEGKLLNADEQKALKSLSHNPLAHEPSGASFADVLKESSDSTSSS